MMTKKQYKTVWGTATITKHGYYHITSVKGGNNLKKLHRLIWEKAWGKIPKNWIIHHLDGNPSNNCLLNLYAMPKREHIRLHHKGKTVNSAVRQKISESHKGVPLSEETKQKISEANKGKNHYMYGKTHSEETKIKMSKSRNITGYYNVGKNKGFYRYRYYEDGKRKDIWAKDIKKLEEKVKEKGLKWFKYE